MATKKRSNTIGVWAFIIGVLAAVILGAFSGFVGENTAQWLSLLLVIVGIIVGLLNVTSDEAMGFLTATAVLVIVTALSGNAFDALPGMWAEGILNSLMLVFVPATIIVALRALWTLARD